MKQYNIMMPNNDKKTKPIIIGNYQLRTTIGKGNSAVVKSATHLITKQKVAIKIFDRNTFDNEKSIRLKREIDSMKKLKHSHIIQLYEIMETPKLICLVTEYAYNGELYDYIIKNKRLSEGEARYFFKQIAAAINYCHKQNIIHRDIKVENLLLDSSLRIKLGDFGFSCTFKPGELLDTWCGSPPYCAPELYLGQLYDGPKVDLWSLGVVLYILVCRRLPFDAGSYNKLRSQVISGAYNTPFFLSEDCKGLIKGLLTVDPKERFTMDDVYNHRWFRVENDLDDFQIFGNLVCKIENISINDNNTQFQPDERILEEIRRLGGVDVDNVIQSLNNKKFDANEAIYHLTEAKLKNLNIINNSSNYNYNNNNNNNNDSSSQNNTKVLVSSLTPTIMKLNENYVCMNQVNNSQNQLSESICSQESSKYSTSLQDNDEIDDIEEETIRQQYMSKNGGFRRHTIGKNPDNNQKTNIMKSTECLIELGKINTLLPINNDIISENNDEKYNSNSNINDRFRHLARINIPNNSINNNNNNNNNSSSSNANVNIDNNANSTILNRSENALNFNLSSFNNFNINSNNYDNCENNNIINNGYHKDIRIEETRSHKRCLISNTDNSIINSTTTTKNNNNNNNNNNNHNNNNTYNNNNNTYNNNCNNSFNHNNVPLNNIESHCESSSYESQQNIQPIYLNSFIKHEPYSNQFLVPPVSYGRRASDGGSNISLYNQYVAFRNQNFGSTASSQHSRGSITSGIPIATISSEDEETPQINQINKYKKNKTHHEPYMDINNNNFEIINNANRSSREQSFGGAPADRLTNGYMKHRASEPNQIDIILSNRAHFERLYNQGISKELKLLQRENPHVDQETQLAWQQQHRNSMYSKYSQAPCTQNLSCSGCSSVNQRFITTTNSNETECLVNTIPIEDQNKSSSTSMPSTSTSTTSTNSIASTTTDATACLIQTTAGVSNNSCGTNILHMIQEEQNDGLSTSTTPRLSQASTISSCMETSEDTNDDKTLSPGSTNNILGTIIDNEDKTTCWNDASIDDDINSTTQTINFNNTNQLNNVNNINITNNNNNIATSMENNINNVEPQYHIDFSNFPNMQNSSHIYASYPNHSYNIYPKTFLTISSSSSTTTTTTP